MVLTHTKNQTIVLCQFIIGFIGFRKTYKTYLGFIVIGVYPFAIILVALLENVAGWQ